MNMGPVIAGPVAGTVAKVGMNAGDAVQQGQVLVAFE
jgi:biotin carboxyl carrier protein